MRHLEKQKPLRYIETLPLCFRRHIFLLRNALTFRRECFLRKVVRVFFLLPSAGFIS